jgi:hypothetical protein
LRALGALFAWAEALSLDVYPVKLSCARLTNHQAPNTLFAPLSKTLPGDVIFMQPARFQAS